MLRIGCERLRVTHIKQHLAHARVIDYRNKSQYFIGLCLKFEILSREPPCERETEIDQTTANQERELRQVAERAGWEIVRVYKDHGISGAKGKDKRPQFDAVHKAGPDANSMW